MRNKPSPRIESRNLDGYDDDLDQDEIYREDEDE